MATIVGKSVLVGAVASLFFISCSDMSERITDSNTGSNNSFEVAQQGMPVNWDIYTSKTVPAAKFTVGVDTEAPQDGKQSLRFDVQECTAQGGWRSPGVAKEFDVDGGSEYELRFWVKNKGTKFSVQAGGIAATTGDTKQLLTTTESNTDWKEFVYTIPVAKEYQRLRFELNVLTPGTLWLDNVSIKKK